MLINLIYKKNYTVLQLKKRYSNFLKKRRNIFFIKFYPHSWHGMLQSFNASKYTVYDILYSWMGQNCFWQYFESF